MKIPTTALTLRDIDVLFRPFDHRKIHLPTRLVMASVPRLFSEDGIPTAEMKLYYSRRAAHEVGLILTEPVAVNAPSSSVEEGMAHFYGGTALRAWKDICRAVHLSECRIAPMLTHAGMLHAGIEAMGPSGIDPITLQKRGKVMTRDDIRTVAAAFARAAGDARTLGFDAVAVDGAGACLVEQFLRAETNHRSDEYGGSVVARGRFACELVQAVRKAAGSRLPIIFRLPERVASTPEELEILVQGLCESGVDIFACTGEQIHLPAFAGSALNMACWVRMLSRRPVIAEGGVGLRAGSLRHLAHSLLAREFDLVAVGRALLADAEWGHKVRMAREESIHPFTPRAVLHLF